MIEFVYNLKYFNLAGMQYNLKLKNIFQTQLSHYIIYLLMNFFCLLIDVNYHDKKKYQCIKNKSKSKYQISINFYYANYYIVTKKNIYILSIIINLK